LSIGTWSRMSTTFDNMAAFGMVKRASFMCSELGRVVAADLVAVLLQEWEHLGGDRLEHDVRVEVLEPTPTQLRLARQKLRVLERLTEDARLAVRRRLHGCALEGIRTPNLLLAVRVFSPDSVPYRNVP